MFRFSVVDVDPVLHRGVAGLLVPLDGRYSAVLSGTEIDPVHTGVCFARGKVTRA